MPAPRTPVPQQPAGDDGELLAAAEAERDRVDQAASVAYGELFGLSSWTRSPFWGGDPDD